MAEKRSFTCNPLIIYYDCEAANGNLFNGDIIEIAARCDPNVIKASFQSLIQTTQELGWFAIDRCGISNEILKDQPFFPEVIQNFLRWVKNTIKKVNKKTSNKYFPVLCAHGGFGFDYIMLLSNMKRHNVDDKVIRNANLYFADSFDFCKELQANNFKKLYGIRLSMDSLFSKFCPGQPFTNRHRAMGDVNAMVAIFLKDPFKDAMRQLQHVDSKTLCAMYQKQYSHKEQQLILEEKMSKLDAYTKCVNLKKLLQIQLTYDNIQRIFENCCSFMDFYDTMKDYGIDRKTAKYFACQFGGLGLKNQGTVPHCGFSKAIRPEDENEELEGINFKIDPAVLNAKEDHQRPANVPALPPDEFTISDSSESWDCETDASRSFVMPVVKPVAQLSVTIDEFVSSSKGSTQISSKKKSVRFQECVYPGMVVEFPKNKGFRGNKTKRNFSRKKGSEAKNTIPDWDQGSRPDGGLKCINYNSPNIHGCDIQEAVLGNGQRILDGECSLCSGEGIHGEATRGDSLEEHEHNETKAMDIGSPNVDVGVLKVPHGHKGGPEQSHVHGISTSEAEPTATDDGGSREDKIDDAKAMDSDDPNVGGGGRVLKVPRGHRDDPKHVDSDRTSEGYSRCVKGNVPGIIHLSRLNSADANGLRESRCNVYDSADIESESLRGVTGHDTGTVDGNRYIQSPLCGNDFNAKPVDSGDTKLTDDGEAPHREINKEPCSYTQAALIPGICDTISPTVDSSANDLAREVPSVSLMVNVACQKDPESHENKGTQRDILNANPQEALTCSDDEKIICDKDSGDDLVENEERSSVEQCTRGVVFADTDKDELEKSWPRITILIGDIPIYVPVEVSIKEDEKNAADLVSENEDITNKQEVEVVPLECPSRDVVTSTGTHNDVFCSSLADISVSADSLGENQDTEEANCDKHTEVNCSHHKCCDSPNCTCAELEDINANVRQPLCYTESCCVRSTTDVMPTGYSSAYFPPHLVYSVNAIKSPQMFQANTNVPGPLYPGHGFPGFVPSVLPQFYSARISSPCSCYEDEQVLPYLK